MSRFEIRTTVFDTEAPKNREGDPGRMIWQASSRATTEHECISAIGEYQQLLETFLIERAARESGPAPSLPPSWPGMRGHE